MNINKNYFVYPKKCSKFSYGPKHLKSMCTTLYTQHKMFKKLVKFVSHLRVYLHVECLYIFIGKNIWTKDNRSIKAIVSCVAKRTKSWCASITSLCLLFFAEIKIKITNAVGIINCGENEYLSASIKTMRGNTCKNGRKLLYGCFFSILHDVRNEDGNVRNW